MTSQINPNNIDGNYPVAGVSNNTQGMRDNFTNTKTNFQYAADEINELQQKAILKSAITGTTLDNNMNDNVLYAAQLRDISYTQINVAATAGTITLDYAAGMYQQINTTGSISLAFANWPVSGTVGTLEVSINITNTAYTVTLPAAVSQGLVGLENVSPGTPGVTNVLSFRQVGNYVFEFSTSNAGEVIYIFDRSRPRTLFTSPVNITANTVSTSTTTGALKIAGGVGVVGNLYVGGDIVGNITITGISLTGNVTGGNFITPGTVFGNVSSDAIGVANLTANNLAVTTISAEDSTAVSVISEASFYEQVFVDSNLVVTGNVSVVGNITPATATRIGGVRAGPGANISNTGLLTIDTTGLPLSFGNFTANNNILTMVNSNENMILATSGNAEVQLIGNIGFYRTNGLPPNVANRYFQATDDGQISILVSNSDPLLGAVEIVGSTTGNSIAPGQPGAMLHITGQLSTPARVYWDGNDDYVSLVARRYNGTVAAPTQVLAGEDVFRINATAATNSGVGNVSMAQIIMTALETQTTTAQGSEITFTVTPVGQSALNRVEVANISVANGVAATKFNTAGTVSATGNVTAGNIATAGLITATGNITVGNISTAGLITAVGNVTAGNVNSYLVMPAGTTSKAPLVFTAGSVTTSPTVGSMNYDGRIFYATPQGNERGLMKSIQTYVLNANYNITDQTAIQSMFGVGTTLSDNTRYAYAINAVIYKTANNITLQYALNGTATLARHTYQTTTTASATLATVSTPSVLKNIITTNFTSPVIISAALNGAGYYSATITGILNVTTGGTWNPQIAFSGLPGAGSYVAVASSVEVWPIGIGNATVNIGNWA